MFDLPEDVSNKKYISTEPEPVGVSGEDIAPDENYSPAITPSYDVKKVTSKPETRKKKVRGPRKSVLTRENYVKFNKNLNKTVQYPALYAKVYDIYYFELVPYKPIDIALKILIILTLLIIVFIVLMILTELLRLIF